MSAMITNKEKRAAVVAALSDPENQRYSDAIIGRMCGVDHKTVGSIRRGLGIKKSTRMCADGRWMNISNKNGGFHDRTIHHQ